MVRRGREEGSAAWIGPDVLPLRADVFVCLFVTERSEHVGQCCF